MKRHTDVDAYLQHSDRWPDVIGALRPILLDTGLTEEIKWGKPCYTHEGANVVILQEMDDFLAMMFFKGALMDDPDEVLREQGPNSRSARRIEITSVEDVANLKGTIAKYLAEAIEVEEAGLEVGPPPALEPVAELQIRLDEDPALASAFAALTPGRQREYNLYFSGAKHAKTRETRVDRYVAKILAGKGFRDR